MTIEITPQRKGCQLSLTHELRKEDAAFRDRTQAGWQAILDVAAEILVDDSPTCGIGIAQHAAIPATLAHMFEALAETLELHRRMLVTSDADSRREDEVYRDLAERWRQIADLVQSAAATMSAQRELPMGPHDESAWGEPHLQAFEKFVTGQSQALAMLRVAAARDEQMLASMKPPA